jgi:hypothetical protein
MSGAGHAGDKRRTERVVARGLPVERLSQARQRTIRHDRTVFVLDGVQHFDNVAAPQLA